MYMIRTDGSGVVLWSKTYGSSTGYETANSVHQTGDGGFIAAGWTDGFGAGGYDAYLVKTDANGDTLWTKTYGGTSALYGDAAYCVQLTNDGGFIIAGEYDDGSGLADMFLVKTDSLGNSGCNVFGRSEERRVGKECRL